MTLTIVMYHYVRDLARSRYPEIKGLSIEKFDGQLDYIAKHYTVVSGAEIVAAMRGRGSLPSSAIWLTFDDGFRDHLEVVVPRLRQRGMTGAFFPPVVSARHSTVLDVHKLHFLLASTPIETVTTALEDALRSRGIDAAALKHEHAVASRWDGPEVMFVKRVLQRALDTAVRAAITSELFERFVAEDELAFARELYLGTGELRELITNGMEVGGHGERHDHLNAMSPPDQAADIAASLAFLAELYRDPVADPLFCYPYGSYDAATLAEVAARGVALAVTTKVGIVDELATPLELKRLDTNDLPFHGSAPAPR